MEILALCATILICFGGSMGVFLLTGKPFVQVTVNLCVPAPQVILKQQANHVFL